MFPFPRVETRAELDTDVAREGGLELAREGGRDMAQAQAITGPLLHHHSITPRILIFHPCQGTKT